MGAAAKTSRKAKNKQKAETDALLAAAAVGTVAMAGSSGGKEASEFIAAANSGTEASGTVATVVTGASAASIVVGMMAGLAAARDGMKWLTSTIEVPEEVEIDELDAVVQAEAEREERFIEKMRERLQRDIPKALEQPKPVEAVDAILEREQTYMEQHDDAAAARVQGALRKAQVKRLSPEGAFWILSPNVKKHTPDCVAMAAVGWWPWSVIDEFNPPVHTGCRCSLLTYDEAVGMGYMGTIPPDTTGAERKALDIRRLTEGRYFPRDPRDLMELQWNRRYAKGTIWGGRFMPKRGGFAPRISIKDILRKLAGGIDAPNIEPRGNQRTINAPDLGDITPDKPNKPNMRSPGDAPSKPKAPKGGKTKKNAQRVESAEEVMIRIATESVDDAERTGRPHSKVVLAPRDMEGLIPSGGRRWGEGEDGRSLIEIGAKEQDALALGQAKMDRGEPLSTKEASAYWNARRLLNHELGHNTSAITKEEYATPEGYALEEALTEELAQVKTLEQVVTEGNPSLRQFVAENPDDDNIRGVYRPQRAALLEVLDLGGVPVGERRELIERLSMDMSTTDERIDELARRVEVEQDIDLDRARKIVKGYLFTAGVHPEDRKRLRPGVTKEELASMQKSDAWEDVGRGQGGAIGASILPVDPNQMSNPDLGWRSGDVAKVTGDKPYTGKVVEAYRLEDGRPAVKVEVPIHDNNGKQVDTVYRYPDPDDVTKIGNAPARVLTGRKITGRVREGDKVRLRRNDGEIQVAEMENVVFAAERSFAADVRLPNGRLQRVTDLDVKDLRKATDLTQPRGPDTPTAPKPRPIRGGTEPVKPIAVGGPRGYDPRSYKDKRRALQKKVEALPVGETLDLADGSEVTRGKRGSALIRRPDGTQRRYSSPARLSNAESEGVRKRVGDSPRPHPQDGDWNEKGTLGFQHNQDKALDDSLAVESPSDPEDADRLAHAKRLRSAKKEWERKSHVEKAVTMADVEATLNNPDAVAMMSPALFPEGVPEEVTPEDFGKALMRRMAKTDQERLTDEAAAMRREGTALSKMPEAERREYLDRKKAELAERDAAGFGDAKIEELGRTMVAQDSPGDRPVLNNDEDTAGEDASDPEKAKLWHGVGGFLSTWTDDPSAAWDYATPEVRDAIRELVEDGELPEGEELFRGQPFDEPSPKEGRIRGWSTNPSIALTFATDGANIVNLETGEKRRAGYGEKPGRGEVKVISLYKASRDSKGIDITKTMENADSVARRERVENIEQEAERKVEELMPDAAAEFFHRNVVDEDSPLTDAQMLEVADVFGVDTPYDEVTDEVRIALREKTKDMPLDRLETKLRQVDAAADTGLERRWLNARDNAADEIREQVASDAEFYGNYYNNEYDEEEEFLLSNDHLAGYERIDMVIAKEGEEDMNDILGHFDMGKYETLPEERPGQLKIADDLDEIEDQARRDERLAQRALKPNFIAADEVKERFPDVDPATQSVMMALNEIPPSLLQREQAEMMNSPAERVSLGHRRLNPFEPGYSPESDNMVPIDPRAQEKIRARNMEREKPSGDRIREREGGRALQKGRLYLPGDLENQGPTIKWSDEEKTRLDILAAPEDGGTIDTQTLSPDGGTFGVTFSTGIDRARLDALTPEEKSLQAAAMASPMDKLKDGEGPVEDRLRRALDAVGIDPYDLDMEQVMDHALEHEMSPASRLEIGGKGVSPCALSRKIDLAVHVLLPEMMEEKFPATADKLRGTSPRWGINSMRHRKPTEAMASPGDVDRDKYPHASAIELHKRLKGMSKKEREEWADREGGKMAPTDQFDGPEDELRAVLRGDKVAVWDQSEDPEKAKKLLRDEGYNFKHGFAEGEAEKWEDADGNALYLDATFGVFVSPEQQRLDLWDSGARRPAMSLWRNTAIGKALGYSDADVARFFSRDKFEFDEDEVPDKAVKEAGRETWDARLDASDGSKGVMSHEEFMASPGEFAGRPERKLEFNNPNDPNDPNYRPIPRPSPLLIPDDDAAVSMAVDRPDIPLFLDSRDAMNSPLLFDYFKWNGGKGKKGKKRKRSVKEVKQSMLEAPPEPVQGIPVFKEKLTDVKAAGGSNGARIAVDKDGNLWLQKTYKGNRDRVATELLANAVYRELGVTVPNAGIGTSTHPQFGETMSLNYPLIEGDIKPWNDLNADLGEGFVADALLANWDVVGLTQDNILWNNGKPIRLDQGGTLAYRAMGSRKDFGPVPSELWTMQRGGGQANGRMFITEEGMKAQAADAAIRLTPERIDQLVDSAPFNNEEMREEVRDALKARVDWLDRYSRGEVDMPKPLEGKDAVGYLQQRDEELDLLPEEEFALDRYFLGQGEIDTHLQSGAPKEAATEEIQKSVKALDALLDSPETKIDKDMVAFIPIPEDTDTSKWPGATLREKSYLPMSLEEPEGEHIRVEIPAGSNILSSGQVGYGEDSTLLSPRNTELKVQVAKAPDGTVTYKAEARKGYGSNYGGYKGGGYKGSGKPEKGGSGPETAKKDMLDDDFDWDEFDLDDDFKSPVDPEDRIEKDQALMTPDGTGYAAQTSETDDENVAVAWAEGGQAAAMYRKDEVSYASPEEKRDGPRQRPERKQREDAIERMSQVLIGMTPDTVENAEKIVAMREAESDKEFWEKMDTEKMFSDGKGAWDQERFLMHARMIEFLMGDSKPVPEGERPKAMFMSGGSAAGKGTILWAEDIGIFYPEHAVHVDADEAKELTPEFQAIKDMDLPDEAAPSVHEESSYISKTAAAIAQETRRNMVVDAVGGSKSYFDRIRTARDKGYDVEVNLVVVDPDEAYEGAKKRAKRTGRSVPTNMVYGSHRNVSRTFDEPWYEEDEDGNIKLDSEGNPKPMQEPLTALGVPVTIWGGRSQEPIARVDAQGNITILDMEAYLKWRDLANNPHPANDPKVAAIKAQGDG